MISKQVFGLVRTDLGAFGWLVWFVWVCVKAVSQTLMRIKETDQRILEALAVRLLQVQFTPSADCELFS